MNQNSILFYVIPIQSLKFTH